MRLLDPLAMKTGDWPAGSERLRAYAEGFAREGSERMIGNLRTRVRVLCVGDCALPVTINDAEYDNTYVCSPCTAYAPYAKEELRLLQGAWVRGALGGLADVTGAMLKTARISRIVHVNNWMLSTNLFSRDAGLPIVAITAFLTGLFPEHFICFRSLNAWANAELMRQFEAAGYKLVASRQVYGFEQLAETWGATSNAREDRRFLARTGYRVVTSREFGEPDYARMAELYRLLYVQKYSQHNPVFTPDYFRLCHQSETMQFFGLRSPEGILEGVLGLFTLDGIVTAPVVGYNTARDRRLGLYRLLMALVFEFALKEGHRINLSSGAASFKRLRGGRPIVEYSAIYDRHLSLGRRSALNALAAVVNRLGVPLMRKLKL